MNRVENQIYPKGYYISFGLAFILFLFYFAVFVTATLLAGHFSEQFGMAKKNKTLCPPEIQTKLLYIKNPMLITQL